MRASRIAVTNSVEFWPRDNKTKTRRPTAKEIEGNLVNLVNQIRSLTNLKVIIACGYSANIALDKIDIVNIHPNAQIFKKVHTRNWNLQKNANDIKTMIQQIKIICKN